MKLTKLTFLELHTCIHTYKDIYKAPFDQKDTKRYRKRKDRRNKGKSQKKKETN